MSSPKVALITGGGKIYPWILIYYFQIYDSLRLHNISAGNVLLEH
jgi:hypothetical protein